MGDDKYYYVALTAVFAAILAVVVVGLVTGCDGPKVDALVARSVDCEGERAHAVLASGTCAEAQEKVDALMRDHPSCRAIYGDSGVDVCALYRKDGK